MGYDSYVSINWGMIVEGQLHAHKDTELNKEIGLWFHTTFEEIDSSDEYSANGTFRNQCYEDLITKASERYPSVAFQFHCTTDLGMWMIGIYKGQRQQDIPRGPEIDWSKFDDRHYSGHELGTREQHTV